MDAIFFEHQAYYPKSNIQQENMQEYQNQDINSDILHTGDIPQSYSLVITVSGPSVPIQSIQLVLVKSPVQSHLAPKQIENSEPELLTYIRRKNQKKRQSMQYLLYQTTIQNPVQNLLKYTQVCKFQIVRILLPFLMTQTFQLL